MVAAMTVTGHFSGMLTQSPVPRLVAPRAAGVTAHRCHKTSHTMVCHGALAQDSGDCDQNSCISCRSVLKQSRIPRWRGLKTGHSLSCQKWEVFEEEMDETKQAGYAERC